MVEVAKQADTVFIAGSNGLLQKQMRLFKEKIDRGDMGEVYMITVDRAASRSSEYGKLALQEKKKTGNGISVHSSNATRTTMAVLLWCFLITVLAFNTAPSEPLP